jgi:hypothetical protein
MGIPKHFLSFKVDLSQQGIKYHKKMQASLQSRKRFQVYSETIFSFKAQQLKNILE